MTEVELLAAFEDILLCDAHEKIMYGGSGSGKTFQVMAYALLKALDEPGAESLMVMETMASVKKDMFEPMCKMLDEWGFRYRSLGSVPMEIILSNGHVINFTSAKQSKGAKATESQKTYTNVKRVVINEATALSEEDDTQIMNRCGRTYEDREVIRTLNPVSEEHYVVRNYIQPYLEGRKIEGVRVHHSTYHDNPHLSKAYTDWLESKIDSDPNFYRVYVLGHPGHLEGLVYAEDSKDKPKNWCHIPLEDFPEEVINAPPTGIGVDPGFNHPTAIEALWDTPTERYVHELVHSSSLTEGDVIGKLEELFAKQGWPKRIPVIWDSARPDQIESAKRRGFNAMGTDKTVMHGIDTVKGKHITISDESVNTIKEFRNYRWKKKDTGFVDEPTKVMDDGMDGIRYVIMGTSAATPNKNRFLTFATR